MENETLLTAVWEWELNLSIETSGTKEGGIESIGTVSSHDNLDINGLIETIHLLEEFDKNTLDFTISSCVSIVSLGGDGIDLINEDNRWRIFLCHPEDVSDHTGALTEILLDELGTDHADDRGVRVMGDSLSEHGLTGTWGSIKKDTTGRVDTDLGVELRVSKRKLNSFSDLLLLDVESTDIAVLDIGLLAHLHHGDGGVSVGRQDVNDSLRAPVDGNSRVWLELLTVQGGQDTDVLLGTTTHGASDDGVVLVDHLNEVTCEHVHTLDS